MEFIEFIIDLVLHIDRYMVEIVRDYHMWTYAILFLVIFCETGLVVTPFLPGDSLLFVAGAISALPGVPLDIHLLVLVVFVAAFLGDSCNYMIGHFSARSSSATRIQGYSSRAILKRLMSSIGNMEGRP